MQTKSVTEIMTTPVVLVAPDACVEDVMALASQKGVHHFPVVGQEGLVGVVCTCDLRDAPSRQLVGALVGRRAVTIPETGSPLDAARALVTNVVGSVLVMAQGTVAGILTREDLRSAAPELAALLAEGHCAACRTARHLRTAPDGTYLCSDCHERAHAGDEFDLGGD